MKLKRDEFDILSLIATTKRKLSIDKISKITKYSIEHVKNIISDLKTKKYIENGIISDKGLKVLEPYRVKRAIFMAAGFGSRMVPITLNTPKPLVRVNGVRIIDTLIDACIKADIKEIYVVRGYLKEQFDQLLYKYPMIKFIDNNIYNKTNNISSVMAARKYLKNAYVLEADLYTTNSNIITKYQYSSNFLGIQMDKSNDWCFILKDGYIDYQGIGGENCYQEIGIAYVDKETAIQYVKDIEEYYKRSDGKNCFWDYLLFNVYKSHYKFEIRECNSSDVVEIDSFDELKAIDKSYDV